MKSPHRFLPFRSGVAAAAFLLAHAALPLPAQQKHDRHPDHAAPTPGAKTAPGPYDEDALKIPIDLRESLGINLERIEIRPLKGVGSEAIAIPRGSVLTEDGKNFVLMQSESNDALFNRVEVSLGEGNDKYVDARSGVLPGDSLISNAMDLLLAEESNVAVPASPLPDKLAAAPPVPPAPPVLPRPYAAPPAPAPDPEVREEEHTSRLPFKESTPRREVFREEEPAEVEPQDEPAPSRRDRESQFTFRHFYDDWHSRHDSHRHAHEDYGSRDRFHDRYDEDEDDGYHSDYHRYHSRRTSRFVCPNEERFRYEDDYGHRYSRRW